MAAPSQLEANLDIRSLVTNLRKPFNPETLLEIKRRMLARLSFRPCRKEAKELERAIRWKRTAAQILADGYVYQGKASTDLVVAFCALCRAAGLETRFVKVKFGSKEHVVAEVLLPGGWHAFDVADPTAAPKKQEITASAPFGPWTLWKKGRDAWDLGLAGPTAV